MSDRDPIPMAPTCPVCAKRDRVQRSGRRWLCGGCWTLFSGGQDEWERTRDMREHYAQQEAAKSWHLEHQEGA